jgi:arylamine N-acetyltransferase
VPREEALLARIGSRRGEPATHVRLAELQRAWCFAQPFHNLDLLAGARHGAPPLDREAAVERCAEGLGGPCHVQSWGFLSLLRLAGFDAHLCGATIAQPDDHLLVLVILGDETYACDVGNGQPYLEPFPLNRTHEQRHAGWTMRTTPDRGELVLTRRSTDQPAWRIVYRARPEVRRWEDFARTIERHHHEQDFGPFLSALRVVRINGTSMVTVRDEQVTVYRGDRFARTQLPDAALIRFIADDLGLSALPVEAAVATWRAARGRRA